MNCERRSPNFTKEEEKLLIGLVQKYINIIECKKNTMSTNREKWATWLQISSEFNAVSSNLREASILKNKYKNLKKQQKQVFGDKNYCIFSDLNAEEFILTDIIDNRNTPENPLQISGDESEEDIEKSFGPLDLKRDKPKTLKRDFIKSDGYKFKDRSRSLWAIKEKELANIQKKAFWEEHTIKIKHIEEIHTLKLEQMKLELDITKERWTLEKELLIKKLSQ